MSSHDDPEGPPKAAMQGGWGDDSKSKKKEEEEDERLRMTEPAADESDTEIPTIPELEEQQEEEIIAQVAEAPSANVQIATFSDLNKDLNSALPFAQTESGVDLKLLSNVLSPPSTIQEEDRRWEFVELFTKLKSEIEVDTNKADGVAAVEEEVSNAL